MHGSKSPTNIVLSPSCDDGSSRNFITAHFPSNLPLSPLFYESRIVEPISHHALFLAFPLIKPMMDVLGSRIGHQP
jgi:hypothetical protein